MWSVQFRASRADAWSFWYARQYYSSVANRWLGYPMFYSTRREARARRDGYKSHGTGAQYRIVRFEHVEVT